MKKCQNYDGLEEWLKKNNINLTPEQWIKQCLTKLGLVEGSVEVTSNNFKGVWKRRKKGAH